MNRTESYDKELLDLFTKMISDDFKKMIFNLIFTYDNDNDLVDALIKAMEAEDNDQD